MKTWKSKIVTGDANANIEKEAIFRAITGGESKHIFSNVYEIRLRIRDFCNWTNLRLLSTYFKRKEIYEGTWLIPGTKETNQIDHVLIE